MHLMNIYRQIEKHLIDAYKLKSHDEDLANLVKCRSIKLTQLHFLLSAQAENSFTNSRGKDSLAELVYATTRQLIADPLSLSPSLVLHILDDELYNPEQELDTRFVEAEQSMREWFAGYRERRQKSPSGCSDLPELRWSDLPNELFRLTQGS